MKNFIGTTKYPNDNPNVSVFYSSVIKYKIDDWIKPQIPTLVCKKLSLLAKIDRKSGGGKPCTTQMESGNEQNYCSHIWKDKLQVKSN